MARKGPRQLGARLLAAIAVAALFCAGAAAQEAAPEDPAVLTVSQTTVPVDPTVKVVAPGCEANQVYNEAAAGKTYTKTEMAAWVTQVKADVATAKQAVKDALASSTALDAAWKAFTAQYNLPNLYTDTNRRSIFEANLRAANGNNTANADDMLAYGITQFSHLTRAEFEASYLMSPKVITARRRARYDLPGDSEGGSGRHLLQGSTPCGKNKAFPYGSVSPPSSWDWRSAGVITPIKNQGGCGSCSAFSSLAALESTWIRKWWGLGYRSTNTDLSEDDWLECTAGDQCAGAWPDSVLDRYICRGAPFESAQPYNAHDSNTCRAISRYNTGAVNFAYVPADATNLARSVRYNPTVIALDASNWHGLAAGWVRNCGEPWARTNHAVLVVGWVDDVPMSNGETWDYWFIRNSWGTSFANSGYLWVRKDCGGIGPYGMFKKQGWTPLM